MKFFLFLVCALCVFKSNAENKLFELNLESELNTQFSDFQTQQPASAFVSSDTDGSVTYSTDKVIKFSALSKYSGIVTTDWIVSPTKIYYIQIKFRGAAGKNTGGFFGYIRSDADNIVRALALDSEEPMDYFQLQFFETNQGDWNTYNFYLNLQKANGIKLYLEKGSYFGLESNFEMAVKGIIVSDLDLGPNTDCPGDAEKKLFRSYYFGAIFKEKNFLGKVQPQFIDDDKNPENKAEIRFLYPIYDTPCVITSMYAFDSAGKVIEAFTPKLYFTDDEPTSIDKNVGIYSYNFTLTDLNKFGCSTSDGLFTSSVQITNYECPIKMYFYLDYAKYFATKQESYNWVQNNSYASFSSSFTVQVNKDTSTLLNTLVTTYVNNQICHDKCKIDMDLLLNLKIKNSAGSYETQSEAMTVIWGDVLNFKIESTPSDYNLKLTRVFVQTGTQTGDQYTEFGDMFISSYVQNMVKSTPGQLTFSMMISGEAGLSKGKPFNLKFLVESDATTRMLETTGTFSSSSLPSAALTNSPVSFKIDATETTDNKTAGNSAYTISCSLVFLLALILVI